MSNERKVQAIKMEVKMQREEETGERERSERRERREEMKRCKEIQSKREERRDERRVDFVEKCLKTRNIRQTHYLESSNSCRFFQLFTSFAFGCSARENKFRHSSGANRRFFLLLCACWLCGCGQPLHDSLLPSDVIVDSEKYKQSPSQLKVLRYSVCCFALSYSGDSLNEQVLACWFLSTGETTLVFATAHFPRR